MSLYTHERAPDAARIKRWLARIECSDDRVLLTEVSQILRSHIYIPSLETTCYLRIKKRIDRGSAILIKEIATFILEILHKIIHPA